MGWYKFHFIYEFSGTWPSKLALIITAHDFIHNFLFAMAEKMAANPNQRVFAGEFPDERQLPIREIHCPKASEAAI
jgi:hypothetical protein